MDTAQERSTQTRRRWLIRGVIAFVALTVMFHLVGGWYFAGRIESGGLSPEAPSQDFGVRVVSYDSDRVVLTGTDSAMSAPGTYSLVWDGGRATIGEVLATDEDSVTRVLIAGDQPPRSLTEVDIDAWMFDTPEDAGLSYSDVTYLSPLGEMAAWRVTPAAPTTTWAIHIHGWRADRREAIRSLGSFADAGITSLVVAYRNDPGMPADPTDRYRFGRSEWEDIDAAVRYARTQGAERIVLSGFSTGGAIAMAFLAESDLADTVTAIVFDSPNLDFGSVVKAEASETALVPGLPMTVPRTLTASAMAIADLRFDIGWNQINYVDNGKAVGAPILVFHGANDETVPMAVSVRFAETDGRMVTLVTTEAAHVRSWNVDPDRYEWELLAFLTAEA